MTELTLDALARPSGTFAMIAMDQRDSLRTMFKDSGKYRDDAQLVQFKRDIAEALTPYGSAFLVDRDFGLRDIVDEQLVNERCAVIAAADALTQEVGGPVEDTSLDDFVVSPEFDLEGISAIKLLIIWRRDDKRAERVELARRFVQAAKDRGVLSVLEPVVRPTPKEMQEGIWDAEAAMIEAAAELSSVGPDLYKGQVPFAGQADYSDLVQMCRKLDEAIRTPWVVLSQGVPLALFPTAVQAACEAGASGFLGGRGLWSDIVGSEDVPAALREVSVPRLQRLGQIVDAYGRPWKQALADKAEWGSSQ